MRFRFKWQQESCLCEVLIKGFWPLPDIQLQKPEL